MRSLTVEAKTLETANELYSVLSQFQAELQGTDEGGYRVVVGLRGPERQVVDVLDAIQQYVTDCNDGPAHVDLAGRRYTMHSDPARSNRKYTARARSR